MRMSGPASDYAWVSDPDCHADEVVALVLAPVESPCMAPHLASHCAIAWGASLLDCLVDGHGEVVVNLACTSELREGRVWKGWAYCSVDSYPELPIGNIVEVGMGLDFEDSEMPVFVHDGRVGEAYKVQWEEVEGIRHTLVARS